MKHYSIAFACLALACGVSSAAYAADTAATLTAARGTVTINQGVEFVPAQVGNLLVKGDRVMAALDSAAEVTFNDGCKLKVQPGTMVTIPDSSTCKCGVARVQNTNPGQTGGVGSAAYAADTAATLTAARGKVMINQGVEFVPAQVGNLLVAGDQVMAARDSAAEVTFIDGCKLKVQPGTVVTIPPSSTCKGCVALVLNANPGETGALGGSVGGAAPFVLVIAGLAVAGYVVAHNANASSNPPLSP